MENFELQPEQTADTSSTDWIQQANRESLEGLNELRAEAGLSPLEFGSDREDFDIDDYTGQFYD